jgi:hypothetical protein
MAWSLHVESPDLNSPVGKVLPLEPGDQLTRPEFEWCYEAMPHLKKAELSEGVVSVPSLVRHEADPVPGSARFQDRWVYLHMPVHICTDPMALVYATCYSRC